MACLFDEVEKVAESLANSDSEYDNSDAAVLKDLIGSIGDFKSKVAGYKATDGQKAVIHSGGALGADHAFGALGSNYGVDTNHYYYGEAGKPTYGTHPITQLEYVQGMIMVNKAAKLLNKTPGSVMPLLARNWMQVRNADVVVAVSSFELDSKGNNTSKVEGGTGWAVAMAEIIDKPVLLYNMPDGLWYESGTDSATGKRVFTAVKGTPKLPEGTKDIAGIGTRSVEYEYGKGTEGIAIEKRSAAFGAIEKFIAANFGDKIGDDTTVVVLAGSKEKKVDKYGERDTVYISEVPGLKTYSSEKTGLDMDSADDRGVIERMFNTSKLSDAMRMFLSDIKGKAVMYTDFNSKHSWLYRLVQDTANSSAITATVVSDHMKSMLKVFSEITYENNIVRNGKDRLYHRVNEDGSLSELNAEDVKKVSKGIYAMRGDRPAEGFGNPFVTRTNLVSGDDTIFVGSNDKVSYEYFMWLTDDNYKYPEGTSEATKNVLDKRKKWVRNNAKLKELAEDTVDIYIQYSGTGRGESVNHVKALIAAARVLVKGADYGKADKNVVSTPIAVDDILTDTTRMAKEEGSSVVKFDAVERILYVIPLIKEIRKATGVRFDKADITYLQVSKYLFENMKWILSGSMQIPTAEQADRSKVKGMYDVLTNTITIPSNVEDVAMVQNAVDTAFRIAAKDAGGIGMLDTIKNLPVSKEINSFITALIRQKQYNHSHKLGKLTRETVLHELVHAITENGFTTTTGKLTKEGIALESIRKAVTPLLMKNKVLAEEVTYWQTDLREFVSEAISNPVLARELAKMGVKNKKNVSNVLQSILDIISGMFGVHKDTVHDAIMYQLGEMVLEQKLSADLANMLQNGATSLKEATKERSSIISNTKDRDGQALSDVEAAIRMSEENKEKGIRC